MTKSSKSTKKAKPKSKFLLGLQIAIGIIVVAWLSYDFFYTFTQGITYKIRLNDTLSFNQHPVVFTITVLLKLCIYGFFIWLIRDCFKSLKK